MEMAPREVNRWEMPGRLQNLRELVEVLRLDDSQRMMRNNNNIYIYDTDIVYIYILELNVILYQ